MRLLLRNFEYDRDAVLFAVAAVFVAVIGAYAVYSLLRL